MFTRISSSVPIAVLGSIAGFKPTEAEHAHAEDLKTKLKAEIKDHIITRKANACPMSMRIAWHSAGTFDKSGSPSGGTNGGTMRFEPEKSDGANAGLHIIHDLLLPIKKKHPEVSYGDLWALAGAAAVELTGGPPIPIELGRVDVSPADAKTKTPPNGRLPDASQGAAHLREVFYRMGFNDREIVALSGGHTLGRCHSKRSGFDGPWTGNPLAFNNDYFKNLMNLEWTPRKWDGPFQYTSPCGKLMMLPTDLALKTDPVFAPIARDYASDENAFFRDFRLAYGKLMALGCPEAAWPAELKSGQSSGTPSQKKRHSLDFREHVMHGSLERAREHIQLGGDPQELENGTGRSALHKGAFWNHTHIVPWLLGELKIEPNIQDYNGDTALHDVARFGHEDMARILLDAGSSTSLKNKQGLTPAELADEYDKPQVASLCRAAAAAAAASGPAGRATGGCASFEEKWRAATVFINPMAREVVLGLPPCAK